MATAVAAVICLAFGGFVGYVTGAVMTDNHYKDKMDLMFSEMGWKKRWRRSHVTNAAMNLTATR